MSRLKNLENHVIPRSESDEESAVFLGLGRTADPSLRSG
jgi:hypothetical protein